MSEKVIGYSLLALGIILILAPAYSVFSIFTRASNPIQFFRTAGISLDLGQIVSASLPAGYQTGKNISTTQEIIPASLINDSANLFTHVFLMGFIASIGYKLASLGIQLLRPIQVKLNGAKD